ncbi:OmpA family protein [Nitrospira sp. NS4]|uniref:OmpA family protein n=1 Tax=Nitrospira sp. NS4 TaxID=3414498 RepID=UPI003C30C82F
MRMYKTSILGLGLLVLSGCSSWQPMCPDNGFQYRICPQGKAQPTAKELADRIAALEKERQRLEAALASANHQTAALTTQTQSLESQLADRDRELAALRITASESSKMASQLTSAQGDLDKTKTQMAELQGLLAASQFSSSSDKERLAALEAKAREKEQLSANLTAAKQHSADLEAQLAAANQRIADLESQLAALTGAAGDKNKLAADLAASTQRVSELERQLADRDQELAGLRGELSTEMAKLREAQRGLLRALRPQIEKGDITVDLNNERLLINLASSYLFGTGEDQLKPAGVEALKHVGTVLKDFPEYKVAVDGHTDNRPIRSALKKKFPTNKELSEARAANAAQALAEGGLGGATTHGYADTKPVATNKTDAGRAKNRRVEVRVTK